MKQSKYVQAYKAIEKIKNDELPSDISYTFFRLRRILRPQWDFQLEEEQKIVNKYNPKTDESGNLKFKNKEEGEKFLKELNDLSGIEVEDSFNKIPFKPDSRLNMSVEDFEALEDFVDFVD